MFKRALFLVLALNVGVQAAPLPAVVEQVLQRHPDLRSAQALMDAADAQIRATRSDFYPSLGLNHRRMSAVDEDSGVSRDRDISRTNATLRWNLFNGRIDSNRLRSAGHNRDAARADLDAAHERIALEVTEAYGEITRLRQRLELADRLHQEFETLRDAVKQRVEAGRISPADLDQVMSDLIRIRAQQSQLRGALAGAEFRYSQLTGQPPVQLSLPWLEAPENARSLAGLRQRLETNPALQAVQQRAAARAAEARAARGALWPSLDLELSRRLQADIAPAVVTDTQRSNQISLNLEIPLGGRTLARMDESVERQKAADAAVESLRLSLTQDLGALHEELQEARSIEPDLLERAAATQRIHQAYRLQFDAGKRSLLEVAHALSEHFTALGDVVDNRNLRLLDQARLLNLTGLLRQTLISGYRDTPLQTPIREKRVEPREAGPSRARQNGPIAAPARIRQ